MFSHVRPPLIWFYYSGANLCSTIANATAMIADWMQAVCWPWNSHHTLSDSEKMNNSNGNIQSKLFNVLTTLLMETRWRWVAISI